MSHGLLKSAPNPNSWRERCLGLLALVLLVLGSAELRVQRSLRDAAFERWAAAPGETWLWKSDPALLAHFVTEIADAGGGVPNGWSADVHVGYPEPADVLAEFTVGQEFIVAWVWQAVGRDVPLELVALRVSSILASLALVGCALAVLAWTGSWGWAVFAALLFSLLPGNYRTLGFLLMREDLAWPLWSLHFGVLVFAFRTGRAREALVSGLFLAAALATWHASRGFLALEVLFLSALFVAGRWPASLRWLALPPLAAAFCVPALRAGWLIADTSFISLLVLALLLVPSLARTTLQRFGITLGAFLVTGFAGPMILNSVSVRGASFEHVGLVLGEKLRRFGVRPTDPTSVPFDARLLWQGPFETLAFADLLPLVGVTLLALICVLGVCACIRRSERVEALGLGLATLVGAALVAHLVGRTTLLLAWLTSVLLTVLIARAGLVRRTAVGLAALFLCMQAGLGWRWLEGQQLGWYRPTEKPTEYAQLFRWVEQHVPPDEAVACDFVNATALLHATGQPIALHPKYETAKSRRAAEGFFQAFYLGTPADLHTWCVAHDLDHLWVDRYVLGFVAPWVGGLAVGEPLRPGSAAATFLSQDDEVLSTVPGFELLYRSPPTITQSNGAPYDLFRWYRVVR